MQGYKADSGFARRSAEMDISTLAPEFRINDVIRTTYEKVGLESLEAVRSIPVRVGIGGLPPVLLNKIRPLLKYVQLAKDEFLFQQDDKAEFVFFPETAVVSEFQMLADGRTIEVAVTGSESAVGIAAVWSTLPAINSAQVCVGGTAYKIEVEMLERELTYSRPLQRWLHDQLNGYIKQISQKVICNTHHAVEERFCTWLLMLHDRSLKSKFSLTQEYIAGVLGVYRPSVTCMAKALREKNVIDYVRGQIFISDKQKLRKMCCACYSEPSSVVGYAR
ncbi:MAG: Crp/Fnr family transcriptional regulator [Acidobacteria bacterium]|nr:Crp/Fnr family transcriptional regulator [Acidobacteriota bacterium]